MFDKCIVMRSILIGFAAIGDDDIDFVDGSLILLGPSPPMTEVMVVRE